jgi:hypothetical protein
MKLAYERGARELADDSPGIGGPCRGASKLTMLNAGDRHCRVIVCGIKIDPGERVYEGLPHHKPVVRFVPEPDAV